MSESKREKKANMYYDEYVSRRNAEWAKREGEMKATEDARRKEEERKQMLSRRARSSNGRPSSKQRNGKSKRDEEELEKRRVSYRIESNPYQPNGFETLDSELGEDPITSIRTMKNRLRKMAVSSTLDDRAIKTQLCQQACEELSKAEAKLEVLQRKRTDMLLRGETKNADQIAKEMSDIRNRAMHSAYVDLVMDKSQTSAFGVKSKWVPNDEETSEEDEKPLPPPSKPKKKEDDTISVKSLNTRKKEREKAKASEKPKTLLATRPDTAVFKRPLKKNDRLFEFETDPKKQAGYDPYGLAEHETVECQFCGEKNTDFSRENLLKSHWAEMCPCLTKCDFCDIVVETAVLNEHHLVRCKFVGNSLQKCNLCGLACYRGEPNHPRCRRKPPPDDGGWCPLCSIAVSPNNSKEAWKKHLTEDCYNNPRKHKSGVPDVKSKVDGFNDDDFLGSIDKMNKNLFEKELPPPDPAPKQATSPAHNQADPYQVDPNKPIDPNQLPPGTIIQQTNGLTPEDIRNAFAKIKEDRKKQVAEMRKREEEREKAEELKAQQDAKRLQEERDKLAKEKAAREAKK